MHEYDVSADILIIFVLKLQIYSLLFQQTYLCKASNPKVKVWSSCFKKRLGFSFNVDAPTTLYCCFPWQAESKPGFDSISLVATMLLTFTFY